MTVYNILPTHHNPAVAAMNKANTKHGMHLSPEYKAWQGMKNRCLNPNIKDYKDYGARGIRVCDEWIDNFASFYENLGSRPSNKHTIDRINNDGDYEPGNCRWATQSQQMQNRSITKLNLLKIELARYLRNKGVSCRELSLLLDVSLRHIYRIVNNETWASE